MPHADPEKRRAYQRAYYQRNREEILRQVREWALAHTEQRRQTERKSEARPDARERRAVVSQQWAAEHPERIRESQRASAKRAYGRDPEKLKAKALAWRRKRRAAILEAIRERLVCQNCGERHPGCLDFHHRDPSQKDFHIARLLDRGSVAKVLAEIEKCDVLCANCHRKFHWSERNGDDLS